MATYTWIGETGSWATPGDWSIEGVSTTSIPGSSDDAVISAPGTYSINLGAVTVNSLTITDPFATLRVSTSLTATTLNNGGTVTSLVGTQISTTNLANGGTININRELLIGTVAIDDSGFGTFANTGAINLLGNAFIEDAASATTQEIGTINNTGTAGFLLIGGTIDNTGTEISTKSLGLGLDNGSDIIGGTILNEGATLKTSFNGVPGLENQPELDGVTIQGGTIDVLNILQIGMHGLFFSPDSDNTLPTMLLMGLATGFPTETLDNVNINLSVSPSFGIAGNLTTTGTLTLGARTYVSATNGVLAGDRIIAHGTIVGTGLLSIAAGSFTNNGTVIASGGTTTLNPFDALLANFGTIIANNGSLSINTDITGTGLIVLAADGTAELLGLYDRQVFSFTDKTGVLKLDTPSGTNTIDGFNVGNTIDLVDINATIDFANGTLAVSSGGSPSASFVMSGVPFAAQFQAEPDGSSGTRIIETVACYLRGTRLMTARGEVPIEDLVVGEWLHAKFEGLAPVKWIGRRQVDSARHPDPRKVWPVRVTIDAFGPAQPRRDLWLSPDHCVFVADVLIPVKYLINGTSIAQVQMDHVTYYHVELPQHDVLLAEGLPAESYLDTGARCNFENGGSLIALHPDFGALRWEAEGCAPLIVTGPKLEAARQRVNRLPKPRGELELRVSITSLLALKQV